MSTEESSPSTVRAYLELVRLPNIFTAIADVLMGFLFTHQAAEPHDVLALLVTASVCLYAGGMVLNDLYDRDIDASQRPNRPIPSDRVTIGAARALGFVLLAGGVAAGWAAGSLADSWRPGILATLLAVTVWLYDRFAKRTVIGPVVMGSCRMMNVLLGMSVLVVPWEAIHWLVSGGIGLYVTGLTWFARREAGASTRRQLGLAWLVMLGGIALVAWFPAWATPSTWPDVHWPERWTVFWIVIGALATWRCVRAVVDPRPALVQSAVKMAIVSLIVIDAGALIPIQDVIWSVAILTLLVPTLWLGRWIYST